MLTKEILCAYAPYGVQAKGNDGSIATIHIEDFGVSLGRYGLEWVLRTQKAKLLLRTLSSLTKPITHNGETFVPMDKLREISGAFEKDEYFKSEPFRIQIEEGRVIGFSAICLHVNQWELFQKLLSWHFDIFGLLESGHAIELKEVDNKS